MNPHQKWVVSPQAKVIIRNIENEQMEDVVQGNYYVKGYISKKANWSKLTDVTNEYKILKEFVEPTVADWKHIEEKMVDGYAWIYESVSEIDLTFIQSNELPNIESDNLNFDIGELDNLEYPSWMIHYNSGFLTRMRVKGRDCFNESIIYAVAGRDNITEKDIEEIAKIFNWKGINKEGPVRKDDVNVWLKNNPDYYLIIYHFNGLTGKTTKREFFDDLEM